MFGRRKTMDVKAALEAGASIRDILWVAVRLGHKDLCIAFALACAIRVEHLDKTGTAASCNKALTAYIAAPTDSNRALLREARSAAYAAADAAAYAAAAAAYAVAADAADAADAYAAAYAADAAAAAAAAAAYAARKREIAEQHKILIRVFA